MGLEVAWDLQRPDNCDESPEPAAQTSQQFLSALHEDCLVNVCAFLDSKSLLCGILVTSKSMRAVAYDVQEKAARTDWWRAMSTALFGSSALWSSWWLRSFATASSRQVAVDRCFAERSKMLASMTVFNSKGGKGNRKNNRKSTRSCFGCACAATSQWRQGPSVSSASVAVT